MSFLLRHAPWRPQLKTELLRTRLNLTLLISQRCRDDLYKVESSPNSEDSLLPSLLHFAQANGSPAPDEEFLRPLIGLRDAQFLFVKISRDPIAKLPGMFGDRSVHRAMRDGRVLLPSSVYDC